VLTVLGEDLGGREIHEMTIHPSGMRSDAGRPSAVLAQPTRVEHGEAQSGVETQAQNVVDHNPGTLKATVVVMAGG
jgi:hypothetical protein